MVHTHATRTHARLRWMRTRVHTHGVHVRGCRERPPHEVVVDEVARVRVQPLEVVRAEQVGQLLAARRGRRRRREVGVQQGEREVHCATRSEGSAHARARERMHICAWGGGAAETAPGRGRRRRRASAVAGAERARRRGAGARRGAGRAGRMIRCERPCFNGCVIDRRPAHLTPLPGRGASLPLVQAS